MPLLFDHLNRSPVKKTEERPSMKHLPSSHPLAAYTAYEHYSIILLSLAGFRVMFMHEFSKIVAKYQISQDDREYLYDWLVTEALSRVLAYTNSGKVVYHYRHDIYKCVYDEWGTYAEHWLNHQILHQQLKFLRGEELKILVAGDNLIIARGVSPNA